MLEALGSLSEIRHGDRRAQHRRCAKRMLGRRLPTGEAGAALFTCAIVLNEERIVLSEVWSLYISTRPAPRASFRTGQRARVGSDDLDAAPVHIRAILCDIVANEREIEVALALCQAIEHAPLGLGGFAHSDQFEVSIADNDNAVGRTAGGMCPAATHRQTQLLAEDACSVFQVVNADNDMI